MSIPIILASTSPRRKELLSKLGIDFTVMPSSFEEVLTSGEDPEVLAIKLAEGKAREVVSRGAKGIVIGGDTLISFEEKILGKPKSEEEAREMLHALSGKTHAVITGVCVADSISGIEKAFAETAKVWFKNLSDKEIAEYVRTGEPLDKAGAYAIQGGAASFVEKIEGEFDTIVGLPLKKLSSVLQDCFGIPVTILRSGESDGQDQLGR